MPTLLVLAAGLGSRFCALKQLEPVGPQGECLLDYGVYDAHRAGFRHVVFVLGAAFAKAFEARVASRYAGVVALTCICQRLDDLPPGHSLPPGRVRPWGTLHAVWAARDVIDGPFAVVNADDFYGREAYQCMADFLRETKFPGPAAYRCAMVAYRLDRTLSQGGGVNRGVCVEQDGVLQSVVEYTGIVAQGAAYCRGNNADGTPCTLRCDALTSMNFWGFPAAILDPVGRTFAAFLGAHSGDLAAECYLPAFVNQLLDSGLAGCRVLAAEAAWFGMTYPRDKPVAVRAIAALVLDGDYPAPLWTAAQAP